MKKLILASAALALSSTFAFAGGTLTQTWNVPSSITNVTKGSGANIQNGWQAAFVVGNRNVQQTVSGQQTIDGVTNATAVNVLNVHMLTNTGP